MHKREWTLLFSEYDLRLLLEAELKKVDERALAIPKERFKLISATRRRIGHARIADGLTLGISWMFVAI